MRILVIIPTTAGPRLIRSLKPRPALPASAAFADGDYRPLPWSADYARLVGAGGPLANGIDQAYELRLSASFDTGRSWEAPVALAHLLIAQGHVLVADPAEADLILWATGALDLDLALIPAAYALLDKIEQTRALFEAAPEARVAVLLPPDAEHEAALARFETLLPGRLLVLDHGLRAVAGQLAEPTPASPPAQAKSAMRRGLLAVAVAVPILAGVAFGWSQRTPVAKAPDPAPVEAKADPQPAPQQDAKPQPPAKPDTALVIIEEVRAPAGQSCRAVVFDQVSAVRTPVTLTAPRTFAASRNDATLCALAFRPDGGNKVSIEVSRNLKELAITPTPLPGGGEILFFRDGARQNVVYTVQVSRADGGTRMAPEPFEHALVP
ncbi:hypothetical protein ACLBXM_19095 [Xanthobacteraceae bacterium A53D]